MKKIISIILILVIVLSLISCSKDKYELVGKVDAVVISKEYKESYTSRYMAPIFIGKTMMMQPRTRRHPEEWNVVLEYEGMILNVNSQGLYDNTEVGSMIKVNYYKYEDKGKIKYE